MSKSPSTPSLLALSCVGAMAFASATHAQQQAEQGRKLGGVTVTDTAIEESAVKVDRAASPKYTAPLVDTPQTITVISRASIEQQNLLTLREVLSTVPGISFAAGEGGVGYGDSILLMGVDAKNDVSVDGVRSGSNVNRNETYNIEQVEVTVGANSVYNGSGSAAGSINLVTKRPLASSRIIASLGGGTNNYGRATIDANKRLSDLVAVRLNAVYHQNDVAGRKVEYYDRWGVAPSITIGIESPTSLTLQYEHLEDHAMPQYGIRYFPLLGGYLAGFDREGYYGWRNIDRQNSNTDSVQAIASHEFSKKVRLRGLIRYEDVLQDTITSQPAGNFCVSNGTGGGYNPAVGLNSPCVATSTTVLVTPPPGYYQPTGGRGAARHIRNETAYSQVDLSADVDTFGISHNLVIGASYQWERFHQNTGSVIRNADGTAYTPANGYPLVSIGDPNTTVQGPTGFTYGNNEYTGPINFVSTGQTFGRRTTLAGYIFDTAKFTDWFQISGGVRFEHVDGSNYSLAVPAPTKISNDLFSYRFGAVFKPTSNTSIYFAHGTSKRPSQTALSEACTALSCNVKPETTRNYEIGAKAELFDRRLLLSTAIFRNSQDQLRVTAEDSTQQQQLDGRRRVQGVSVGATGNITDAWTINGSYMYADSKILQNVADGCLIFPRPAGSNCTVFDTQAGGSVTNTPKHSGSVFTTYTLPFGLTIGYGVSYQGRLQVNAFNNGANPASTPETLVYVPSYFTHRLSVAYVVNDAIKVQLNVQNLWNEEYVTTVRTSTTGGWAQRGAKRSAVLSLTGTF
ncbi:MAG TPA: TonB-dependent receptor [Sphingobium sp.]